ncbi:MAG TPA: protein-L-isoaspartate O-methyltransferase [Gammaproteobacteria bacterium]|nr:protein-L-isoaspartate O-methyltransferase [Gammaproteobacteria bacterium]
MRKPKPFTPQQVEGIGMTSQRTRDRLVKRLRDHGIQDERVLSAISHVPRHLCMDEAMSTRAYEDTALPIGEGQTISQPYIVARMTEAVIRDRLPRKVLEVGTGSGYQAAVLAQIVEEVYTVERIKSLYEKATCLFQRLGYQNIHASYTDGTWGLPDKAPFDAIVVTAACQSVPEALLSQLVLEGQLIAPINHDEDTQILTLITRKGADFEQEQLDWVRFVPFVPGCA